MSFDRPLMHQRAQLSPAEETAMKLNTESLRESPWQTRAVEDLITTYPDSPRRVPRVIADLRMAAYLQQEEDEIWQALKRHAVQAAPFIVPAFFVQIIIADFTDLYAFLEIPERLLSWTIVAIIAWKTISFTRDVRAIRKRHVQTRIALLNAERASLAGDS